MKVLIIKLSSLGDIIDTFAALTDAGIFYPEIKFDWVVEEAFSDVPRWHSLVNKVISIGLRNFRKNLFNGNIIRAIKAIREEKYDLIIDSQGLLKSGLVSWIARGTRVGLDWSSLTEKIARIFYQKTVSVDLKQHAVFRMRSIFAKSLNYRLPETFPDFCIASIPNNSNDSAFVFSVVEKQPYVIFLHGTTWATKHLPDAHWQALAKLIFAAGYRVYLPWSNEQELERVQKIKVALPEIIILPKMNLTEIKNIIQQASLVIAIDTGLAHLAAILNVPTLVIYGPTDPKRIGAIGKKTKYFIPDFICLSCDKKYCRYTQSESAACLASVDSGRIWQEAKNLLR